VNFGASLLIPSVGPTIAGGIVGEIVEGKVSITLAALKGSMTGVWHIGSATGATLARVDANVEREAHAGQEP
jgi:hypothetical protein